MNNINKNALSASWMIQRGICTRFSGLGVPNLALSCQSFGGSHVGPQPCQEHMKLWISIWL